MSAGQGVFLWVDSIIVFDVWFGSSLMLVVDVSLSLPLFDCASTPYLSSWVSFFVYRWYHILRAKRGGSKI